MPLDWMDVSAAAERAPEQPEPAAVPADSELLAGLNDEQRRAVTHGEGPLLILAGAGSGKTRVITRRIGWLVASRRAAAHEILAITFTNKAAGEMRARVGHFLPVQGLWISTFHAMCARILRREIGALGGWTNDFSIYDTHERNLLLKQIVKELGFDLQTFRPNAIGAWISAEKNRRFDRASAGGQRLGGIEREIYEQVRTRYAKDMRTNNALDFERDFGPGGSSTERPVVVVKLERNYRSTECILKAAQGLIRHNLARKEKDLWTDKQSDARVRVLECADENDEARAIAQRIQELVARGRRPDQVAVFYRVNFMQRALERALRLAGLPYQIVGGVEFYERREVRDLVCYLRLIVNPRDDGACTRVLNVPARGIGEKSVEELSRWSRERGLTLAAAVHAGEARELLKGRARKGLEDFARILRELAPHAELSASAALEAVLAATDYLQHLSEAADDDALSRVENVEELLAGARQYDSENPEGKLRGYLQDVALVSDVDGWEEASPRVTLMTLHSSKGLEFPAVFIAGLEEGLLPHALALSEEDEEAGVEEERRLLYVGMTRAMDELFLSHADLRLHYGETSFQEPSRFLAQLPREWVVGLEEEQPDDAREPTFVSDEEERVLRAGERVEHDHFGYGVVEALQGSGVNTRVTVRFRSAGTKVLLLQYAKLRVVEG